MTQGAEVNAPLDELFTSNRVVLPEGEVQAAVGIRDGLIAWVGDATEAPASTRVTELGDLALLPGAVDTHVHINDPGTDWEGFTTAGRAAVAGGVTTLVDMPLNSLPVTTTPAALDAKRIAARDGCAADHGFWGGVVPGNLDQIDPLADAGVLGFKCFLSPSGLDEFAAVSRDDLAEAMPAIAATGLPLLVHAESPDLLTDLPVGCAIYADHVASRPPAAEVAAIEMMAELSIAAGCAVHIVHVASAEAVGAVRAARAAGASMTAETCPHYLTFAAEEIPHLACAYKCAPPIRHAAHRDALWRGLEEGALTLVATDHSPCPPDLKHLDTGDLCRAWGGIASLQVGLRATWTGLVARGGGLATLMQWMAHAPAQLAGLDSRKGSIARGFDADLVIFDPDRVERVEGATLQHRHSTTPYEDLELRGVVLATYLRGARVYHRDESGTAVSDVFVDEPRGMDLSCRTP